MRLIDVYWTPNVNHLKVICDCGHNIDHPSRISLCECPSCGRAELWHSVKPAAGIWDKPVMRNEMTNAEAAKEDKGLRVIDGGKATATAPKDPFDHENWLDRLDKGTVFLYRKRTEHPGPDLDVWRVSHQFEKSALLSKWVEDAPDIHKYVDKRLFSNLHQCVEIIWVPSKEEDKIVGEINE